MVKAQNYCSYNDNIGFSMGIGVSVTNLDVGSASPVGMAFDFNVFKFHFDFATNLASGKGDELDFSSSETTKSDKQSWYSINMGYNFDLKNNWYLVPKVGLVVLNDIWEDPVGWNTYYEESAGTKVQCGVEIRKEINNFYLRASCCTTEIFSCGIGFTL